MKTFINVAQMKLATLQAGQFVETGGYYTKGDAGQAKYLIVAAQAADGYGDHVLANGTVAVLQENQTVRPKQFGCVGDGINDDSAAMAAVNTHLTNSSNLTLDGGGLEYVINYSVRTLGASNLRVQNLKIKAKDGMPLNLGGATSVLMYFQGCSDLIVENVTVDGNRATRIPAEVYSHSIVINDCQRVALTNVTSKNAVVDGFFFASQAPTDLTITNEDFVMVNCHSYNSYRNNMSVIAMFRMLIDGCTFVNANGISPEAGVDFEPDPGNAAFNITDIKISGCIFKDNNEHGLVTTFITDVGTKNYHIENCLFDGNAGLGWKNVADNVSMSNCEFLNNALGAIEMEGDHISIRDIKIKGIRNTVSRGVIDFISSARPTIQAVVDGVLFEDIVLSDADEVANHRHLIYIHSSNISGDYTFKNIRAIGGGADVGASTCSGISSYGGLKVLVDNLHISGVGFKSNFFTHMIITKANTEVRSSTFEDCSGFSIITSDGTNKLTIDKCKFTECITTAGSADVIFIGANSDSAIITHNEIIDASLNAFPRALDLTATFYSYITENILGDGSVNLGVASADVRTMFRGNRNSTVFLADILH